jgi:hypothetical protein
MCDGGIDRASAARARDDGGWREPDACSGADAGRIESDAGHLRVVGSGADGIAYGAASRRQPGDRGSSRSDTVQGIRLVVHPRALTSPGSLPSPHRGGTDTSTPTAAGFGQRRARIGHHRRQRFSSGDEAGRIGRGRPRRVVMNGAISGGDPGGGSGQRSAMGSDRGRDLDRWATEDSVRCDARRSDAKSRRSYPVGTTATNHGAPGMRA